MRLVPKPIEPPEFLLGIGQRFKSCRRDALLVRKERKFIPVLAKFIVLQTILISLYDFSGCHGDSNEHLA